MSIHKLNFKSKKFLEAFKPLLEKRVILAQAERLSKEGKTSFYLHRIQDEGGSC